MNLKYIDCHSHPHDEKFEKENIDIDTVLLELKKDGGGTIAIGTDYELSKKALSLAKKHENVWCTIGVHPADNHAENFDERFEKLYLENKDKIKGIGECGLDYYYFDFMFKNLLSENGEKTDIFFASVEKEKQRQKKLFIKQIEFALKYDLPLVLHGRPSKNSMDAYRDMLDILESFSNKVGESHTNEPLTNFAALKGHAHFFVGNIEIAKRFLDIGFLMSFDGPITFTKEYDSVIDFLPIENIMIETDSPYAAPMPHRGKICLPEYVKFVADKIGFLKNKTREEVLEITKANTIKLFKLK